MIFYEDHPQMFVKSDVAEFQPLGLSIDMSPRITVYNHKTKPLCLQTHNSKVACVEYNGQVPFLFKSMDQGNMS